MELDIVCRYILFFFSYSFLGWVCECVYCSLPARKFINRGFLAGPLCPVYGFGALLVIRTLSPVAHDVGMLFIFGLLLTTVLEYITGFLLEKLFHMKWWDYSGRHCNIHGRVCLLNSVLFGILCVVLMKYIHPPIQRMIIGFSLNVLLCVTTLLLLLFFADLFTSVRSTLQLNGKLQQLHLVMEEIQEKSAVYRLEFNEKLSLLRRKQFSLEHHHPLSSRRILKAFPHLKSTRYHNEIERIRRAVEHRHRRIRRYKNKKTLR